MEGIGLIQDLAIVLLAAGITGLLCRKIGLSVIVGYLLAGIVVGPYTPPFCLVSSLSNIEMLSQVGLVFLMFAIGLGLSISKLGRMGLPTILATGLGALFVVCMTRLLGLGCGWTGLHSAFVAGIFVVSSSAVIARIVEELRLTHEPFAQRAVAVTVMEDIVAVVTLTILAGISGGDASAGAGIPGVIALMGAFVVLLVGGGLLLVPKLFKRIGGDNADPELQTIVVAGLLFLLSISAAKAGYSLALGAFLLGAMVAEMPQKKKVEASFSGMRDLFSSVFFVSIGMMIDPMLLAEAWPWILALTAFVLIARPVATGLALTLTGIAPKEARRTGLLLTPLGEFSFIIAQLGVGTQILPEEYYPITVGVSLLTVFLSPLLNRHADAVLRIGEKLEPRLVTMALDAWHGWMMQFRTQRSAPAAIRLTLGRFGQVGVEMLLVTGIIVFPPRTLPLIEETFASEFVSRTMIHVLFWTATGLVALTILNAIWRNISAISMILGDVAKSARINPGFTAFAIRAVAILGLLFWLSLILPLKALPPLAWVVISVVAAAFLFFFSRRLVYWHGVWRCSVQDVISAGEAASGDGTHTMRSHLGDWHMQMEEFTLQIGSDIAFKSIADLNLPARFGVSILRMERNGYVLPSLAPSTRITPGDRLLLAGARPGLDSALKELGRGDMGNAHRPNDLRELVMNTFAIPDGPLCGKTLAQLRITSRTGVRIVGIERGGTRILTPDGSQSLSAGDLILTVGTLAEQRAFDKMLTDC